MNTNLGSKVTRKNLQNGDLKAMILLVLRMLKNFYHISLINNVFAFQS